MKKGNRDSMFQRPNSEPSQEREKKNKGEHVRLSGKIRCIKKRCWASIKHSVARETDMKSKSFCMLFVCRSRIENVKGGAMNRPTSSSGRRSTRPSMNVRKKSGKLARIFIMKGFKVCAFTWRECSDPWSWYKRLSFRAEVIVPEATV